MLSVHLPAICRRVDDMGSVGGVGTSSGGLCERDTVHEWTVVMGGGGGGGGGVGSWGVLATLVLIWRQRRRVRGEGEGRFVGDRLGALCDGRA